MKCVQGIVFHEWKQGRLRTGGSTVPLLHSPLYRHGLGFSHSFLRDNALRQRLLKVLLHLFPRNSRALCGVCLRAGTRERPPGPFLVWFCREAALTLLGGSEGAPLLWSSAEHTAAALGGLWVFYISSALSVWRHIHLSSHPLALRLSWSIFHCVHPDGFYRLDFSSWFFFFFQYKDVTVYFRF